MKRLFKTYRPYSMSSLTLAVPVIISQLGHMIVQMADSIIAGQLIGTIALAAVSLVHSLFMTVLVIGMGIAYGITPLIAQESAKGNVSHCTRLLSNGLILNFSCGILLFLLIYFTSIFVIDHLNQDAIVIQEAKPYLFILSLSIIPVMIFSAFKQFLEGLGFTRQAMNITIWGNVFNIILGIILVKGLFGFPPMGIRGIGIATLVDRILMASLLGIYLFKGKIFSRYISGFRLFSLQKAHLLQILKIGAPVAMQYIFEIGAFSAAAVMAGMLGAIPQAAHQIAIQLAASTYMMASGLGSATTIKIGNSYGKKNFYRLKMYATANYHIVLTVMGLTAALFILLNQYLPYIFTTDISVISIAAQLLVIAGFFQLFDGTQVIGLGILRGLGDVNVPTAITFFAYWIVAIPIAFFLGIKAGFGIKGIWVGLCIGLISSSILLFLRYKAKIKTLT